ncbi:hypothetical protein DACRYDRAFT_13578 [Dacryopinax primogenitus]|uniref:Uncharacterized protein n=1 Tax=Dacryopinax primogenitus (strain DJM 731) TaxID=1858805 RepID=M5GGK1_DACPD|nr:uncharacterized protein DACRYDRAFT_13578 [Dacryopinax primogenitus]EJU05628.1 hypothetical protein DACRYDRAFT_13578 [Dacryopinax primogenitus]
MALQQTTLPCPTSHTTLPLLLTYAQVIHLAPGTSVEELDLDLGLYKAPTQLVLDLDKGLDKAPTQHTPEESGLAGQTNASSVTALLDTDGEAATGGELEQMLLLDADDKSAGDGQPDPAPEPVLQP